MSDLASVKIVVYGSVQGVFFRDFTSRRAEELGLTGYVRNLPGGSSVGVLAEGEKARLEKLIGYLKTGPPRAVVERVEVNWSPPSGNYSRFSIRY
ncbi:MAG: acylphosphatase [Dehalococcoidales bacterium]|nr:acylphosphatase [Dehalococcoidales bacterium]